MSAPGEGPAHASHAAKERARDEALVNGKHNTARYFTETRHVAWVALVFTLVWGVYGYLQMPKAKDPAIAVRVAVATCLWPGAEAEKIEQLVTRRIEQKLAENASVEKVESISRTSLSVVYVTLKEDVADRAREFDDIQGRLNTLRDLPSGAGPIQFLKDFGDTSTLLLTVSSPKASPVELDLRARALSHAITEVRGAAAAPGPRATLVVNFPPSINAASMQRLGEDARRFLEALPGNSDAHLLQSPGFIGVDVATPLTDAALLEHLRGFVHGHLSVSELHPDVWRPLVVRDPKDARARLEEGAGDRYSYRELDDFTDALQRRLQRLPLVSKVTRTGVLPEKVFLEYSQERLASYGLQQSNLSSLLAGRNITAPGGIVEVDGRSVTIDPSGEFSSERQVGDVVVTTSGGGAPVYLRDLVDVRRDYQSPARFLHYLNARDAQGHFTRTRAITLAVNMRPGEQIGDFGAAVDAELSQVKKLLPEDLVIRRTSDQPLQVRENVHLFMSSLYEAIFLVVLVALVGFWEWRTALLLALSIPITLAMTFGLMHLFGVDIQQISIASLIIALGLLVDDPVVASDAIKHSLSQGWKPRVAAWLGPTKLATAILFATLTNIAAYLPFLTLPGDTGKFIHSLPIVLTLSLVASRIVSMTFVPLLGSTLLRAPKTPEPSSRERRSKGFARRYAQVVGWAIDHRFVVVGIAGLLLVLGGLAGTRVKSAFFPKDLSYLSYVDVWLPEDATLSSTRDASAQAVTVVREVAEQYGREHPGPDGEPREVLASVTEFVGGGGPRFWFSVAPEQQQLNYAQLLLQVEDKEDTRALVPLLQEQLSRRIAGARLDVRELETGKPVGIPVSVRISGEDIGQLRALAEEAKALFRSTPGTARTRDDWGSDTFAVKLEVDPDRANLAGVTNLDVATSSAVAMNGMTVGQLREGNHQIDIVARLRADERAGLGDIENLYVSSRTGPQKVPLRQVSHVAYSLQTEKIRRRNQFRTITVATFPQAGVLPSEVMKLAKPKLDALRSRLPVGYTLEVGGEAEEQVKSFRSMAMVMGMLLVAIYVALAVQFKNAIKPLVVFAALPFGAVAAVVSLDVMGAPLSFMAFLGIISLMGVIVSHIIVLFDYIEEAHERGEPLREALLDAGLMRLRPVLVTVAATVLGLIPLALHGGPLWQPLCYAQVGGLTVATVLTLLLVPVLYTLFVRDLKWIRWDAPAPHDAAPEVTPPLALPPREEQAGVG
ncbi:efflux RND transporter permease subunit [Corallococcus sp. Z5C101001]|uniref:efflux RND transporter permease subunit n=1 Tax=Corallococcus sp. Z5C101001 TaxID=2596829 RepID=UPI00117D0B8F|nr:efflux RND transporter permease subunit [Corallococcus sp. Z5C101001]TSC34038.1 efflux RND transporter permease subunit [Corallococcus sp. Z5C101001]